MTMAIPPRIDNGRNVERKLKAHKKSRLGCANCKLRKVKCDENKPVCKPCESYGIFCNYSYEDHDDDAVDRRSATRRSKDRVHALQISLFSEHQTVLGVLENAYARPKSDVVVHPLEHGFRLSVHDLELMHKFHHRTIWTLGAARYRNTYLEAYGRFAYSHPFLLHLILTLTTLHDKHLGIESGQDCSKFIAYHWSRGAALLNRKLSGHIEPGERDALWACAGLLGALSFADFDAKMVEDAWPLKPASSTDLGWLRMSEGKKEIRRIADPMRKDSLFYATASDYQRYTTPSLASRDELDRLPPELVRLCTTNCDLTDLQNPYLASLSFLARTIDIECTASTIGIFLLFFGSMHPNFKQLIREKDPAAMLLLACWYAKVSHSRQWWIFPRASMECEAICKYLTLYHSRAEDMVKLTQLVRQNCITR